MPSGALSTLMDRDTQVRIPSAAPIQSTIAEKASTSPMMNDRLDRLRKRDKEEEKPPYIDPPVNTLCGFVLDRFRAARSVKQTNGIQKDLTEALRYYHGEYDCEELAALGGSQTAVWYPLINSMVRRMHAFLRDTLADDKEHPRYDYRATTVPDVPQRMLDGVSQALEQEIALRLEAGIVVTPQDVQEAIERLGETLFERVQDMAAKAAKMCKAEADDRLDESNYAKVFDDALLDLCIFGTGLVFGPFSELTRQPRRKGSNEKAQWGWYRKTQFKSLDPLRFFPSVCSTDGSDGDYWCYVDKMSRAQMRQAQTMPGWIADNVELVLRDEEDGYSDWSNGMWSEGERLRGQHGPRADDRYDVLWYYGTIRGKMLIEMNINDFDGKTVNDLDSYEVEIYQVRDIPIKIMCNTDPKQERPLHKSVLFDCPGAFWGQGVWHIGKDKQRMCNSAFRSIVRDMGYSSAPIFEVDTALTGTVSIDNIFPGMKIDKDTDNTGLAGDALAVHQIRSNSPTYMGIIQNCVEATELMLGLPRFLTGATGTTGAARTATGLQQLQSNAFINVKSVIVNIDHGWTRSAMGMLHRFIMATTEDPALQGDVEVVTLGATAMLARQLNRDNLMANLGALMPFAQAGMIAPEGINEILREVVANMGLDPDKVVPDQEVEQALALLRQQALQQGTGVLPGISGGVAGAAQGGTGAGVPQGGLPQQQQGGQLGGQIAAGGLG